MTIDIGEVLDRVDACQSEDNRDLVERTREIKLLWLALIARANMILMGPAAVAKSMTIDYALRHIAEANLFKAQVNTATPPELIFGNLSAKKLIEDDLFERKTEGFLPWAHVGYIDETTRGNRPFFDGCLQIINEREYSNGQPQPVPCPLWSFVGAANDWPGPDRTDLNAFLSRLAIRIVVEPVQTKSGILEVFEGQLRRRADRASNAKPKLTMVTKDEIEELQRCATEVTIPEDIQIEASELYAQAGALDQGHDLRRMGDGMGLMQAQALLRGDDTVARKDLRLYEYIIPKSVNPEDLKVARELTLPYAGKLAQVADAFRQEYDQTLEDLGAAESEIDPDAVMPTSEQMGQLGTLLHRFNNLAERIEDERRRASDDDDSSDLDGVTAGVERAVRTIESHLGVRVDD